MREVTKKRKYCKECGSITSDGEYKTICDYCQVIIPKNTEQTFNMKGCYSSNYDRDADDFHFCNIEHFLKFFSNADIEKYDYLFLPLIYKNNFKILQERLSK